MRLSGQRWRSGWMPRHRIHRQPRARETHRRPCLFRHHRGMRGRHAPSRQLEWWAWVFVERREVNRRGHGVGVRVNHRQGIRILVTEDDAVPVFTPEPVWASARPGENAVASAAALILVMNSRRVHSIVFSFLQCGSPPLIQLTIKVSITNCGPSSLITACLACRRSYRSSLS